MNKSVSSDWIDSLRAVATLGVICIHLASPQVNMSYGKNMDYWWIGSILDSLVRFAVPIFLMISGATLLGKEYPLADFYRKRMLRVLIPFVFWILVYVAYRWLMLKASHQPSGQGIFPWVLNLFLKEGVSKHFWYVYMILFIYLIVPFLGRALRQMINSHILLLLGIWVIACYLLRKTPMNLYGWTANVEGKFLAYILYTGYLVLGFFLFRVSVEWGRVRALAIIVFLGTVAVSSVATYYYSIAANRLDLSMYSYLNFNTIVQASALFILVKDSLLQNKVLLWVRNLISEYSFGIYLVHILVIGIFFRNGLRWDMTYPLLSLPLLTILVLGVSIAVIFLLRKLPYGKYVSG